MIYHVIIPARGGSRRYPRKNIQLLNGKPLIAYSIEYALDNFAKEFIWVNTDDQEIAEIAEKYNINITIRPDELGGDYVSTADVLYFQNQIFLEKSILCDSMILLQPTNPLRPAELIKKSIMIFEKENRNSLASFTPLNKKYGKINSNKYHPSNYTVGQRMQDIEPEYFENGLIYITKINSINQKNILTDDAFPLIIDDVYASVDIDEPSDMIFAEYLINNLLKNNG
jgi:CMP-N-acetylneuraminic acid synthetase